MKISEWLAGAADAQLLAPIGENELPMVDDDDALGGHHEMTDPLRIEIDYIDTKGNKTHRPFIVQSVCNDFLGGQLSGFCLLRHARRTLFFQRISGITTIDGEYMQPATFFYDRLGIDRYGIITDFVDDQKRRAAYPNDVRALLRPKLGLLVIAAKIDGELHRDELDRIMIFAERELLQAEKSGKLPVPLTLDLLKQMELAVTAMTPDATLVAQYVKAVEKLASRERGHFWRAFCDVINADLIVTPEERELLLQIEKLQLA